MTCIHTAARRAALGASALAALLASSAMAAPPPAEAFGRLPALQDADISPDGTKVAILGEGQGGARVLTIAPIDSQKAAMLNLGDVTTRDVRWAGDDYVLVTASYFMNPPWDVKNKYHFVRQVVVDTNGKALNRLGVEGDINDYSPSLPLLGVVAADKPFAVIQGYDQTEANVARGNDTHFKSKQNDLITPALFKIDVKSGHSTSITERGTNNTDYWDLDASGQARVRVDINQTTHDYNLMARKKGSSGWKVIDHSTDETDAQSYMGYSDPEDAVYRLLYDANGAKVVRHNLADDTDTVVPTSAPARTVGILWDRDKVAPLALYYGGEHYHYDWLDKEMGSVYARLAKSFEGKDISFVNWSADRTRLVVRVESGDTPPVTYLLDLKQKSLSPLGEAYPELKGAALGHKSWITYKASDGLEIPAYVTMPSGAPATGGKLPLIVLPHGGPADRDAPGFDWWSQFLASRGYVVLQPQFRGSGGFGRAFEEAGHKEWSGKMQTDLIDGVKALAAKGVIDPNRVCIVGASYGGFAALEGATLHSDVYKCAVSVNGVADIGAFVNQSVRNGGYDSPSTRYWRRLLGYGRDTTISPVKVADQAKGPVLLIHAVQDTTVFYEQSEKMQKALSDAGKPVELVSLQGDDHYLSDASSRVAMLKAVDAFLAKNLPVAR
jgi:dipeptidyl aminopeptidase/acylaminoacyl peptidase